ncbi:MAG TPA: 3-dehydroquinate synthase [bacterium]|jgi:3-dehydroquinate synthase|nr:3-dehydroquinate synthase [bacterium]
MKPIEVKLGPRSYKVHVGNGLLKRTGSIVRSVCSSDKVMILSTSRIYKLYGKTVFNSLRAQGFKVYPFFIPDGEAHKNEKTLLSVLDKMARLSFQRDSCLLALGGGVVGDLGGFAASIYMRGIQFVQCPTTFLAQVDAGIGGKTAIDFKGIKNLVGSFYQPKVVVADTSVLKTLNDRQLRTGLAEVIKYGVIQDPKMFGLLEAQLEKILHKDSKLLSELVWRSCDIKARIVSADEREGGKRAWLNYGHTLGHALEAYFKYDVLTHGEAIAFGMSFAGQLSVQLGLCGVDVLNRQNALLKKAGLFRAMPDFNAKKVYEKMFLDKKVKDGQIQFVLTRKIGLVTIQKNVPQTTIFSILRQLQA